MTCLISITNEPNFRPPLTELCLFTEGPVGDVAIEVEGKEFGHAGVLVLDFCFTFPLVWWQMAEGRNAVPYDWHGGPADLIIQRRVEEVIWSCDGEMATSPLSLSTDQIIEATKACVLKVELLCPWLVDETLYRVKRDNLFRAFEALAGIEPSS